MTQDKNNTMTDPKIIVALDYQDAQSALNLVQQLDPEICRLKVGKELFTATGPHFIDVLHKHHFSVFLDLKFHDIPNTVAKACLAASNLGVWMLNVHASGGFEMMQAASEAVKNSQTKPLLIAVTVLTSMNQTALSRVGIQIPLAEHVLNLARLTQESGFDGVVCSAQESSLLRSQLGKHFKLVTPGIRPKDVNQNDQSRVVTPAEAIQFGSNYLVIGRPITQAENPQKMLEALNAQCLNVNFHV